MLGGFRGEGDTTIREAGSLQQTPDNTLAPLSQTDNNGIFNIGNNNIGANDDSGNGNNPSKIIVFLTDGKADYTPSGEEGSFTDLARDNGYTIYSMGLNIEQGDEAEEILMDMATATGGQYFASPTAANLDETFNEIFQQVVKVSPPINPSLVLAVPVIVESKSGVTYLDMNANKSYLPLPQSYVDVMTFECPEKEMPTFTPANKTKQEFNQ